MALVSRSKRNFDFIPIIENKLGPGEYEKEFFNNNSNNKSNNNIPFNSSKKRISFENINKNNSELGPGYYFKENQNTFLRKSFSKDNIEEDIKDKKEEPQKSSSDVNQDSDDTVHYDIDKFIEQLYECKPLKEQMWIFVFLFLFQ